jgi:Putative transposase of IS4/5 family (DUF4096)
VTLTEKLFSPHHGIGIARTIGILNAANLIVRPNEGPSIRTHSPPHAWFQIRAYLRFAVMVAKHEVCTVAAKDLTIADKDFVALGRSGAPKVDEIFCVMRTGALWRDLPEELGKWNSVYQQFRRWSDRLR